MSTPQRDSAASRAEARRRARLAARGELPEEEEDAAEAPADAPRGGILSRLFPPAPELPNKPPALAGFDESGPLRPIRVRAFLLRRNLMAWLGTGFVAAVGYFGSIAYRQDVTGSVVGTVLPLVATFLMFGALIAAGWFGWQRPALFGTAAAIVSYILVVITIVVTSAMIGVTPDAFGEPEAGRDERDLPGHLSSRPRLPGWLVRRVPAATPDPAEHRSRTPVTAPVATGQTFGMTRDRRSARDLLRLAT